MMTEETRRDIDQLREELRTIGATLRQLRQDLGAVDQMKSGPRGEIDLEAWNKGEEVREQIRGVLSRRGEVERPPATVPGGSDNSGVTGDGGHGEGPHRRGPKGAATGEHGHAAPAAGAR